MSRRTTVGLLAVAVAMLAFIVLYERGRLTSGDVEGRQGRLLERFARDRIDRVEIERGGETIRLERTRGEDEEGDPTTSWRLLAPVEDDADDDAVDTLVGSIEWADAKRRLDDVSEEDLTRFGLERPALRIRVVLGSETVTLAFGGEDPTGAGRYARVDDDRSAFVVGPEVFEAVDHDAGHFREKTIVRSEIDEPARLVVADAAGERVVTRDGHRYWLEGGARRWAAAGRVESTLRGLAELRARRFVAEQPSAEHGLASPLASWTIEVRDGDASRTVRIAAGAPCPGHDAERVLRVDEGPVACVTASDVDALTPSAVDLLEHRAITVEDADVRKLELERGGRTLRLEPSDDDDLDLVYVLGAGRSERRGEVDPDALGEWLRAVRHERLEEERAIGASPAALGLAAPIVRLRIEGGDRIASDVVAVGRARDGAFWLRRGEEAVAWRASDALVAALEPQAGRVRTRALLDIGDDRLTSLSITRGAVTERLVVTDGAWRVEAPVRVAADRAASADLARRLGRLEAVRFVADDPLPEHGLRSSRFVVEVGARAEDAAPNAPATTHRIVVGAAAPGGAYAQLGDDPAVFVITTATIDLLERPLIDRGALEVDSVHIESVTFRRQGAPEVTMRREGGDWRSPDGPVDAERARRAIDAISTLRVDRAGSYGPPVPADGMTAPRLEITIGLAEGAPEPRTRVVRVGAEAQVGERALVHVRRGDLDVDFLVDPEQVAYLLEY